MSILKRTVFVMTFFWHSAWDEKMGETLSSAEYFQPGEQMVGWCFMLLVELYLLVYPRVNSIPPIKVKHQHETNGWAWIFDFWINQLISEHVFLFQMGQCIFVRPIHWLEGRTFEPLGDFEKSSHHPKPWWHCEGMFSFDHFPQMMWILQLNLLVYLYNMYI